MKLAIMSTLPSLGGTVPDSFENAPAMLIVETDTSMVTGVMEGKPAADYTQTIIRTKCEAVVCGPHIGEECFEPIARASITRYNGVGLSIEQAVNAALRGSIPLIADYEGGHGCSSGTGSCEDGHCEG